MGVHEPARSDQCNISALPIILVLMTIPTNQVAVERVDSGGTGILDATFEARRSEIVAICRSLVGDEAEDVVHDAYLRARAHVDQLRDPERAAAWMTKIAVNICFERHRRRDRLRRLLPFLQREPTTSDPDLIAAIENLPTDQRAVVVLFYGYGLSLAEIANLLDRKSGTTRSLLFRARGRLRNDMELDQPA